MCEADLDRLISVHGHPGWARWPGSVGGLWGPAAPAPPNRRRLPGAALRGCAGWHVRPISAPCIACLLPPLSPQPLLLLTSSFSSVPSFSLFITPTLCLSLSLGFS